MERRLTERVQFFQCPPTLIPMPVSALDHSHTDTTSGLLLDISDDGVQILTSDDLTSYSDTFELTILPNGKSTASCTIATMQRQWSKPEDANFIRSGFAFAGDVQLATLLDNVLDARDAGRQWFRCNLVSVHPHARKWRETASRHTASGVC